MQEKRSTIEVVGGDPKVLDALGFIGPESFAGPPTDRKLTSELPKHHHTTRTLPRGSACADRYGKTFVVWPDGSHGYTKATRVRSGYSSFNFAPYTVLREGLTERQCDDIAAGDRCGTDPIPEAGAA